jgi:hypothetical protein
LCGSQEPNTNDTNNSQCEPIVQVVLPRDESNITNHELPEDNFQISASLQIPKTKLNDRKEKLSLQIWYNRICSFIKNHTTQLETYSQEEITIVQQRFMRYSMNNCAYSIDKLTPESFAILEMVFKLYNPKDITSYLIRQASLFAVNNQREEFEKIMLNFGMIINSPKFEVRY